MEKVLGRNLLHKDQVLQILPTPFIYYNKLALEENTIHQSC